MNWSPQIINVVQQVNGMCPEMDGAAGMDAPQGHLLGGHLRVERPLGGHLRAEHPLAGHPLGRLGDLLGEIVLIVIRVMRMALEH